MAHYEVLREIESLLRHAKRLMGELDDEVGATEAAIELGHHRRSVAASIAREANKHVATLGAAGRGEQQRFQQGVSNMRQREQACYTASLAGSENEGWRTTALDAESWSLPMTVSAAELQQQLAAMDERLRRRLLEVEIASTAAQPERWDEVSQAIPLYEEVRASSETLRWKETVAAEEALRPGSRQAAQVVDHSEPTRQSERPGE